MSWRWLAALLLATQAMAASAQDQPDAGSSPAKPAFELKIEAPSEIQQLLATHLELQRYQSLSDLGEAELQRLIDLALPDARQLIATLGYFSPLISIQQQPKSEDGAQPVVHIQVSSGPLTQVSQVNIIFAGAITGLEAGAQRQLIQSSWPLGVGERFTQLAWDSAKLQALRQLTTARYPSGQLRSSLAEIDADAAQARLTLTLDSGPAYHTGELRVSGLKHFEVGLVQRLARLVPGTAYDQAELVAAQQRLIDSGYFDSALVTLDASSPPEQATVLITVREVPLQKIVLGVGASTDGGARLSLEHTHHQLPGIGWRALSKLQLERDSSSLGTELIAAPDADNWRWAASAALQNQLLGTLDVTSQRLRGGRSQNGARIDRNLYLQYDRAASVDSDSRAPVIAQSVTANYAFSARYYDRWPFPRAGWGWGAELGGGSTLGSLPQAYARWLTRWQGFWRAGGAETLTQAGAARVALRASAAAVLAKDSTSLPSTQLFLAGGDNSVRGYALRGIGVTLADGSSTAGRYLLTGSVEWQQPLRWNGKLSAWEGTLFLDAGAVANQVAALSPKVGLGVGARWNSPVGPLQIDLAYGIDLRQWRLHMNLGFSF